MPVTPEYELTTDASRGRLSVSGDWTIHTVGKISDRLASEDASGLDGLIARIDWLNLACA